MVRGSGASGGRTQWLALAVVALGVLGCIGAMLGASAAADLPENPDRVRGATVVLNVGPLCDSDLTQPGVACFEWVNATVHESGRAPRAVNLSATGMAGYSESYIALQTASARVLFETDLGPSSVRVYSSSLQGARVFLDANDPVARADNEQRPPARLVAMTVAGISGAISAALVATAWMWYRSPSVVWARRASWALVAHLAATVVMPFTLGLRVDTVGIFLPIIVAGVLFVQTRRWIGRRTEFLRAAASAHDGPGFMR